MTVLEIAKKAKEASYVIAALPSEVKNQALSAVACALRVHAQEIMDENKKDLQKAKEAVENGKLKKSLYERLKLTDDKLNAVTSGIEDLIKLPDPVGKILSATELDESLCLYKTSCPIGLLGVIFEARPDVVPQIVSLAIKSGNAVVLKGGKEAEHTNDAIIKVIHKALQPISAYPLSAINLIHSREETAQMLELEQFFDLIIPRGGNALISYVKSNTKIPVLGHADGVCHIYVAKSADLEMAKQIVVDAKTQYPSACNAVESLLLDAKLPASFKKDLLLHLQKSGISLYGNSDIQSYISTEGPVENWHTEYGEKKLSVKIVSNLLAAITHINTFGSHHTDAILTREHEEAQIFMDLVDSAGVYHNASTRFADGYRYGFGAEVGISTAKTHARGPVGLEGLTIYKYKLYGNGQKVADYIGKDAKKFTHKKLGAN